MSTPDRLAEPPGFYDLPKTDQVRYLQDLWDRIATGPGEIPVPESHLAVVRARLADYRRDPKGTRPASTIVDEIASKAS